MTEGCPLHRLAPEDSFWTYEFLFSSSFVHFIDLLPEAVVVSNEAGQVVLVNAAAQRVFAYDRTSFLHLSVEDLLPADMRERHIELRAWFFENPRPRFLEDRNYQLCALRKNGEPFPMEASLFMLNTDKGRLAINLIRDVSNQKKHLEKVVDCAFVDKLTGLPNRHYYDRQIAQALACAKRYHRLLALLFIDLDKFKPVNDRLGHQVGDQVLSVIAQRLANTVRETDFLARIGGDEFIVLASPVDDPNRLSGIAERICAVCRQPIEHEQGESVVSASIGICYSDGRSTAKELFVMADRAMYSAKRQGGDCFVTIRADEPDQPHE